MNNLTPGEEVMIAALARQVADGDWAACGTLSPLPAAALWLAKLTHAPHAEIFVAGSAAWPFDGEWREFFDVAQAGRLNVFFLSGAQIDGQGNINLMAIGSYEKPRVRLPGGAGSAILAYMVERVVLFKAEHTVRGLVPRVDILTAPGYTKELSPWQRPGRVSRLVTPKCVFDLSPPAPPRLASLHAGVTLAEVQEHTGFAFEAAEPVAETAPVDREARGLLYGPVKEKLAKAYPHFATRLVQSQR